MKRLLLFICFCAFGTLSAQTPSALAPILVGPYDGGDVVENNVIWTWFMQSKASGDKEIQCDLVVAEILPGQTPEEALRLNPPVILKENLTTSSWQTNFAVRSFQDGHRYAWRIIANIAKNGRPDFRAENKQIVSQSEIWTFTYSSPKDLDAPAPDAAQNLAASPASTADSTVPPADAAQVPPPPDQPASDNTPPIFQFKGQARLVSEYANRTGNLAENPNKNYARLQLDPTLSLFGVPMGMNFLITTEENVGKSDISRGAFGSQSTKRGLNFVFQQRLNSEIAELERARDSAQVDSLRQFAGADSIAFQNKINALYELGTSDLSENLETLKEFGLVTSEQELLAKFPSFGFGKVAPQFGRQLFSNVTINGGMLEYNPGNFYSAAAVGKVQRDVDVSAISPEVLQSDPTFRNPALGSLEFFRNVYSARIGYGRRNGNHIVLTGIYANDDDQSVFLQGLINQPTVTFGKKKVVRFSEKTDSLGNQIVDIDSPFVISVIDSSQKTVTPNTIISPQRNYGFGAATHFALDSMNVAFDGEFNLMYFEDRANYKTLRFIPLPESLPEFLKKDSTLIDINFAAKAKYSFFENDARLSAGIRYVGGGFRSIGTAGLRGDILRTDAAYDQVFFQRQLRANAMISFEEAGYKDTINTSKITTFGGGLEFRPRGLPVLQVNYSQHVQNLTTDKHDTILRKERDNYIRQASVSSSYFYGAMANRMATFAVYTIQTGNSEGTSLQSLPDSVGIFESHSFMLSHRVAFGEAFSIGAVGSLASTSNHPLKDSAAVKDSATVYSLDFSTIVNPYSWWQSTVGATYSYDKVRDAAIRGAYFSTRLTIDNLGEIDLRMDYRKSDLPGAVFPEEFVARLVTGIRW
ncbi:MAG: hypothetical protein U0264_06550 [Candidatus Kapaibacterium sp.]